eukprot:9497531-Pyramimonas_sp.AAC.1
MTPRVPPLPYHILSSSVAPQGAQPTAPVAALACVNATHFGTPLTRFVAPQGVPPNAPAAGLACANGPHPGTPFT